MFVFSTAPSHLPVGDKYALAVMRYACKRWINKSRKKERNVITDPMRQETAAEPLQPEQQT